MLLKVAHKHPLNKNTVFKEKSFKHRRLDKILRFCVGYLNLIFFFKHSAKFIKISAQNTRKIADMPFKFNT